MSALAERCQWRAGSHTLEAPSVEITYGLERILMSLQSVDHFKDIRYNEAVTYGELFLQNEYEMSVYNLDQADVSDLRTRFDLFESVRPLHSCVRCAVPVSEDSHSLAASLTKLHRRPP